MDSALSPDVPAPPAGEPHGEDAGGRLKVLLWDERLTSWEAERLAAPEAGPGKRRKATHDLDAHAAAVILQSFLDSQVPGRRVDATGTDG